MPDPMSDERLAEIREDLDLGTGDLAGDTAMELLAEVDRLTDALTLAEDDGDSVRRDLTAAYKALIGVMPGSRPSSASAAAERDAAREQVRVIAGVLKRGGPKFLCPVHPDSTDRDCTVCRDRDIATAALDGTEAGS